VSHKAETRKARIIAKKAGWSCVKDEKDFCPICKKANAFNPYHIIKKKEI